MKRQNDAANDAIINYLYQPYYASLMVESCKQHIQRLKDEQQQAARILNSESGCGRPKWRKGKLEDLTAQLLDYIDIYAQNIVRYLVVTSDVQKAIDGIKNPLYRYILQARYINLKSWTEITKTTNYCRSSIMRYHKLALAEISGSVTKEIE